jgi:hypothetical protein
MTEHGERLLCILLHASFTAAQDHLLLATDSPIVDGVLFGTYLVAAGVLIAATGGRLGMPKREETLGGAAAGGGHRGGQE